MRNRRNQGTCPYYFIHSKRDMRDYSAIVKGYLLHHRLGKFKLFEEFIQKLEYFLDVQFSSDLVSRIAETIPRTEHLYGFDLAWVMMRIRLAIDAEVRYTEISQGVLENASRGRPYGREVIARCYNHLAATREKYEPVYTLK